MKISASVVSSKGSHQVELRTGDTSQSLDVPAKPTGDGSALNGGELLMLALATCYCNDLYREANRLQMSTEAVGVPAEADFEVIGTRGLRYLLPSKCALIRRRCRYR